MIEKEYLEAADYKQEHERIVDLVKRLRRMKSGVETNWMNAAEWHMKYSNLHGKSVLALTITLSPTGCEWALKGGCTMCGEFEGSYKQNQLTRTPEFHIAQFASAIGNPEVWMTSKKEGVPISWLRINQEGSFTNSNEVNIKSQEVILRLASKIQGIKRITIESRPQYLDEKTLSFLEDLFAETGVELEIGMGLEAEDDIVRNVCVNKAGTKKLFANTVESMKKHSIHPLAYVLLKPPFLTENEAIKEAVDTAHYAANIGFERISFEPLSIHQYTLVDVLKEAGVYKTPWLWSIVEVVRQCSDISDIFGIGGVGYYPIPSEYAHNVCTGDKDCNEELVELIKEYNKSRDAEVFSKCTCSCKQEWEKIRNENDIDLRERMRYQLNLADSVILSYDPLTLSEQVPIRKYRIINGDSQTLN